MLMKHFIKRHISKFQPQPILKAPVEVAKDDNVVAVEIKEENKKAKKDKTMTSENIERMEQLANELSAEQTTKRIKKDKGLIERIESEKTMLTEDNKQLLLG